MSKIINFNFYPCPLDTSKHSLETLTLQVYWLNLLIVHLTNSYFRASMTVYNFLFDPKFKDPINY